MVGQRLASSDWTVYCWLLAAGCWLLAAGCLRLAAGCWLLAAGCWLLAAGCWLLAAGCWLLAAGCWLLAAGCWRERVILAAPPPMCMCVSRRPKPGGHYPRSVLADRPRPAPSGAGKEFGERQGGTTWAHIIHDD